MSRFRKLLDLLKTPLTSPATDRKIGLIGGPILIVIGVPMLFADDYWFGVAAIILGAFNFFSARKIIPHT